MFDLDEFLLGSEAHLGAGDYVDIECSDCVGCEKSCCRELSGAITLDSYDVALLKQGLGKSFDELVTEGSIEIREIDGVPLPIFGNKKEANECVFLNAEGRCSIHPYRGGICRMYPLARRWRVDDTFYYFLQKGECEHRSTAKTRVSDWLGYSDVAAYEAAVKEYHKKLRGYRISYNEAADKASVMEKFFDENFR